MHIILADFSLMTCVILTLGASTKYFYYIY